MFKLVFRNLFRHMLRTAITFAAIMFGVTAIVLTGGFVEDIFVQLGEATIHSRLGHLQLYRAGYYLHGRRDPFRYMIEEPDQMVADLAELPHITEIMQRLSFSGLLNNGRADQPILGEGVEPEKEARLGTFFRIIGGRQLTDKDPYGVLVGEGVARSLVVAPGDFVTLLVNTTGGAMNSLDFQVVGVFQTFAKDYDARAIRIPLVTAQQLLDTGNVHSLVFALEDTGTSDTVAHLLSAKLSSTEFEVKTWQELADFYRKAVALYRRQFGVLQLIILFMVLLTVANSVNMSIYERTGELGTLRALGQRASDVFKLMLLENTLLGLLGAGAGVGVGILLAWTISKVGIPMPPPPNSNMGYTAQVRVVTEVVILAFLVGTAATVMASILPARRASRLPVVEALRASV